MFCCTCSKVYCPQSTCFFSVGCTDVRTHISAFQRYVPPRQESSCARMSNHVLPPFFLHRRPRRGSPRDSFCQRPSQLVNVSNVPGQSVPFWPTSTGWILMTIELAWTPHSALSFHVEYGIGLARLSGNDFLDAASRTHKARRIRQNRRGSVPISSAHCPGVVRGWPFLAPRRCWLQC